ncbi:hypothetical protein [Cupriavidus sp. RAF12]|uniref:hypothetical protein n=1 Tax=Cupriavidus sp. RAF12 TaxID=3233050 RepID=UPI003F8DC6B0
MKPRYPAGLRRGVLCLALGWLAGVAQAAPTTPAEPVQPISPAKVTHPERVALGQKLRFDPRLSRPIHPRGAWR